MLAKRVGVVVLGILFVWSPSCGDGRLFAADEPSEVLPDAPMPQELPKPAPAPQGDVTAFPEPDHELLDCPDEQCDSDCAEYCGACLCGPPGRFWIRADYLLWWTSGTRLPPLVTAGTAAPPGTYNFPLLEDPAGAVGYIDEILFGNSTVNAGARSNLRVKLGAWLDSEHVWGLEGDYFTLGQQSANFSRHNSGYPVLARPYCDVERIGFWRELVSYPGGADGTINVSARDYFHSAGIWGRYNLCSFDPSWWRMDLVAGYRYYHLNDSVVVREDTVFSEAMDPRVEAGDRLQIEDNFRARNDFHGAELGLLGQTYRGRWSLEILTKMAIGTNHQVVTVNGSTVVTRQVGQEQQRDVRDGGVFAVRSNTERSPYTRNEFVVIPQLGVEVGYQLNPYTRAYFGYNLLYWCSVARAADQIDLNIDPRNIPPVKEQGLPFPAFQGRRSSFWAQGINLGLEFRY